MSELVRRETGQRLPPLQKRLLEYLEAHKDEVVTYRDETVARALEMRPAALGFTLWALQKKGLIDTLRIGRRVYFGVHEAIAEARKQLQQTQDTLRKAKQVRERIKRRRGLLDGLALLEQSRARA